MSGRVFRIREEGEGRRIRVSHRWLAPRPKARPSGQELLLRLLDLRIRGEADGEAYLELLREYVERASREGIDAAKLEAYIERLEMLGDEETLREVRPLMDARGGGRHGQEE
jgi:hypothetical protein